MEKRKAVFWTCNEDDDNLVYTDIDDAVEDLVESHDDVSEIGSVTVYGFAPCKVSFDSDRLMNWIEEQLYEEYGYVGIGLIKLPDEARKLGKEFTDKVCELYSPWKHDIVDQVEVDVQKWWKENMEKR